MKASASQQARGSGTPTCAPSGSLFAPVYAVLEQVEAEATRHESYLRYTAPYWWKGRANEAAIARLRARQLRRGVAELERLMEKVRERDGG